MANTLKVDKLQYSINAKKIIRSISFELGSEEVLAVLGESGSGKSTLLKLIAGFLDPDKGTLLIEGEPIPSPSEKLIPGHPSIKMVRQDNPLFPNHSLRENIDYELRKYNSEYRKERVNHLLKLTGLQKVADQLPRQSSEGEQQRASIARALADEPALLLLDEPFSNLDYGRKKELKKAIKDIVREEKMACIFVTHDISDVFGTANQLAILKDGKISQLDDPVQIYRHPNSQYEAGLTGEFNIVEAKEANMILKLKSSDLKVLIRPEDIELFSNEGIEAEIGGIVDYGAFRQISLKIENLSLTAFTSEKYLKPSLVKIKINRFTEINR
ncbi:ABC transporter ATP-binding protein [Jiulongibacter sediminis]|uniref:ABC transporter ATP-binding protein n=1 Tax=Jiulongibacter sediminis TaxID=1605367 RepID=UPI0012FDDA9D|nr:ABC transporter ATP-binding protein [Jiulongibacter sediminis]